MKVLRALCIFAFLAVAFAAPPMPDSVVNAQEAIRDLWQLAHEGIFMNTLPWRYRDLQAKWADFLYHEGPGIVNSYYDAKFPYWTAGARWHGKPRFLRMVTFADTKTYSFRPSHDAMKPEVAALLVQRFAEKMPIPKTEWGKDLSLAQPGTTKSHPHSADR
ncbi:hypothetical protein PANT_5c00144 [Moesziomyces antarcticus T-34]|uniref:Uncharacterized protein n=1 Tax=Pseudozyma antarctica (strain T-34) TaxID=1151754 RepID=M9MAU7_PSEA3|nr:hypothetical protein PANT_5c00144 [Moesziomyces antarcticus T-34]